jgi:hypothetical protein
LRPDSDNLTENIYFVNGLWNTEKKANAFAKRLQTQLVDTTKSSKKKWRIRLVYNDHDGYVQDLLEAMIDKTWVYPYPITNQTTLALLSILYNGKAEKRPIGIIGHSQGTLIICNAIFQFSKTSEQHAKYLKENVRIILSSPMIHDSSVSKLEKLVTYCELRHDDDKVSKYVNKWYTTAIATAIRLSLYEPLLNNSKAVATKLVAKTLDAVIKTISSMLSEDERTLKEKAQDEDNSLHHDFAKSYVSEIDGTYFVDLKKCNCTI